MSTAIPAAGVPMTLEQALRRAFGLGQTYWQQADSESYSQNAKADATIKRFEELVSEVTRRLSPAPVGASQAALEAKAPAEAIALAKKIKGAMSASLMSDRIEAEQCRNIERLLELAAAPPAPPIQPAGLHVDSAVPAVSGALSVDEAAPLVDQAKRSERETGAADGGRT